MELFGLLQKVPKQNIPGYFYFVNYCIYKMLRKCSNLVVLKNELTAHRFEQNGELRCGLCLGIFSISLL